MRISELGKSLLVESRIWKNFACVIQNPGRWNSADIAEGTRNPTNHWNPETVSSTDKDLNSVRAWNPEAKNFLDSHWYLGGKLDH